MVAPEKTLTHKRILQRDRRLSRGTALLRGLIVLSVDSGALVTAPSWFYEACWVEVRLAHVKLIRLYILTGRSIPSYQLWIRVIIITHAFHIP
ncbi:hypothetical protein PC128_g17350 [Phytophthora cactorum]|nr:hypothetical protein PC128_g17350 [Phytophthora cactorum]